MRELETETGVVEVGQSSDGYTNVTPICQAKGKLFSDWRRLEGSQEYLEALSSDMGIPISDLLVSVKGGDPYRQGTWAHPEIAVDIAVWCRL